MLKQFLLYNTLIINNVQIKQIMHVKSSIEFILQAKFA